jgi:cytochrome c
MEPKANSVHPAHSLVRYSISVSDKEDGESRFDEIPADKILLEVEFIEGWPGTRKEKKIMLEQPSGLRWIKKSDCFSCHQFRSRLIGPSFQEIATRYADEPNAKLLLASSITNGSKAVWGEAIMPAHPDISLEASREIAEWILKTGLSKDLNYLPGKEGSFRTDSPPERRKGFFRLKATYEDNGTEGNLNNSLSGYDVVMIQIE